jgi:hypothetical protein
MRNLLPLLLLATARTAHAQTSYELLWVHAGVVVVDDDADLFVEYDEARNDASTSFHARLFRLDCQSPEFGAEDVARKLRDAFVNAAAE